MVEDVVLGIAVFAIVEVSALDWSVVIDGGVWTALVSDESTDEARE
jgi:hypothetical protein